MKKATNIAIESKSEAIFWCGDCFGGEPVESLMVERLRDELLAEKSRRGLAMTF